MEILKITIPEGFKVESFNKDSLELKLIPIPKDIKKLIKTFSDVLDYHGIDSEDFDSETENLEDDEVAYKKLKLIVSAYNEKEVPNFDDRYQRKYEPRFKLNYSGVGFSHGGEGRWNEVSGVGSRLCFLDYENMKDAVSKFLDVYKMFYK